MKTIWKVLIGIGVFIFVIVVFAYCATSPVADVADEMVSSIKSGDNNAAYQMTSSEFKEATTMEQFEEFIAQYPQLKNFEKFNINSRETEGDLAQVVGTLTQKDGTEVPVAVTLIKEDGKWKVFALNVETQ